MEDKSFRFDRKELIKFVDDVIDSYSKKTSGQYEIINFKLDAIENQTTRTNGRLGELEKRVLDIEKDNIGRILTCPQSETINELVSNSISVKTMKKIVVQAVVFAGIFFTILFGLIRLLFFDGLIF